MASGDPLIQRGSPVPPPAEQFELNANSSLEDAPVRRRVRVRISCRCLCCCLAVILLVVLGIASVTFFVSAGQFLAMVLSRPYSMRYAADPFADDAVMPLIGLDTKFDVAVTIYIRTSGSQVDRKCDNARWSPFRAKSAIQDQELFSDVVLRDFSMMDTTGEKEVHLSFDVPLDEIPRSYFRSGLMNYDIRAAVSFLPKSVLDNVVEYTHPTRENVTIPKGISDRLDWGIAGSLRRQVLDDMVVHIPLLVPSHLGDRLVTRTHVFMMNETHPMDRKTWLQSFEDVSEGVQSCKSDDYCWGTAGSWFACERKVADSTIFYAEKGHFLAKYHLNGQHDSSGLGRLAYNPYFAHITGGPTTPNTVLLPPRHQRKKKYPAKLTLAVTVFSPLQKVLNAVHRDVLASLPPYHSERERQRRVDMWAFSRGVIGLPNEGVHTWRRVLFIVIHKSLAFAVAVLTVLYWYTRKTAAGISHAAVWMRVLVVIPTSIHYLVTSPSRLLIPALFGIPGFIVTVILISLGEFFQLRLIAPIDICGRGWAFDSTGSSATFGHSVPDPMHNPTIELKARLPMRRWTHRERASMRLEPVALSLCLTVITFGACVFFFVTCQGYIIPPPLPLGHDRRTADALAVSVFGMGWAGYATATILQLRMNHVAHSFAGTYALVAYMQVGVELCNALYNSKLIMGAHYVSNGLSIFEASHAVFAVAVMAQAAMLPRVEQHIPDDDE